MTILLSVEFLASEKQLRLGLQVPQNQLAVFAACYDLLIARSPLQTCDRLLVTFNESLVAGYLMVRVPITIATKTIS